MVTVVAVRGFLDEQWALDMDCRPISRHADLTFVRAPIRAQSRCVPMAYRPLGIVRGTSHTARVLDSLTVTLTRRRVTGGLIVATPAAPGWKRACDGGLDLAAAIEAAWAEAAIARYARARGLEYDLVAHDRAAEATSRPVYFDPDRVAS